jgi:hypothetical protein
LIAWLNPGRASATELVARTIGGVKTFALALRFLLELAALAALGYAGISTVDGALGWLLGASLVVTAAVAWGLFVAPRARIAARTPVRFAVEVAVFAAACAGLLVAGRPRLAAALATLYAADRLLLWFSGAPAFEPNPGPPGGGRLSP